jgi:pimeloyl-ACP methyl ester carboxylesterase
VVVICHGFKAFKDWGFYPYLAESISAAGLAVIRFNFSHNGVEDDPETFTRLDLFARNTFGKEIEDLTAVLEAIGAQNLPYADRLDPHRIFLLGHSRGAVSVILVAASQKAGTCPTIRALATWAGISTGERWTEEEKQVWHAAGKIEVMNTRTGQAMPLDVMILEDLEVHAKQYDLQAAVQSLRIPYLVVHGDEDETVPLVEGTFLHDNTPRGLRKLQIIPGAGHTFGAVHPFAGTNETLDEAIRVTIDWFKHPHAFL